MEKKQQETLVQLQNGQVSVTPEEEEEPARGIMGLDLSTWEDQSGEQQERSLGHESSFEGDREAGGHAGPKELSEARASAVVVQERVRGADEPGLKNTRAKRESRRMRELEQAKFSLELLKVRATGGGASSPSEERRWSVELAPLCSPQGTPDSQSSRGSFELLGVNEEPPKAVEESTDLEESGSPAPSGPEPESGARAAGLSDAAFDHMKNSPAAASAPKHPPKIDNYLPTFYVPANEGSTVTAPSSHPVEEPHAEAASSGNTRHLKDRRGSTRRPVVVVISMQKETPLSEGPIDAVASQTAPPQNLDQAPALQTDQTLIEKLMRLNEEKEERQRNQQQQNEKEMMEQIRQQKEALVQQRRFFVQYERDMFEKHREEALSRIQQSRQPGQDGGARGAAGKPSRPSSLLIERPAGSVPHARTQSDSDAPSVRCPPAAPRELQESRPPADGWAPKLTLESREGGTRARTAAKQPRGGQGGAAGAAEKPGNIFFSPKDKVSFARRVMRPSRYHLTPGSFNRLVSCVASGLTAMLPRQEAPEPLPEKGPRRCPSPRKERSLVT